MSEVCAEGISASGPTEHAQSVEAAYGTALRPVAVALLFDRPRRRNALLNIFGIRAPLQVMAAVPMTIVFATIALLP